MPNRDSICPDPIDRTWLECTGVTIRLRHGCPVEPIRGYPLLSPLELTYLKVVIADTVDMTNVLCRYTRKNVSGRGLELMN